MGQESSLKIVVLGKIGAPFGVQGWVHLHSYASPPDNILSYKDWYLRPISQHEWRPIRILQARAHGKHFAALLEGCLDRDQAQKYTNADLGISRDELPELDEGAHYWEDLIGLAVITETGEPLGTVDSLFETGANDVLVVKGDKEHLIPFVPEEVILSINQQDKTVVVRWDPDF